MNFILKITGSIEGFEARIKLTRFVIQNDHSGNGVENCLGETTWETTRVI